MKCSDVENCLRQLALPAVPDQKARDGLVVGRGDKNVSRILIASAVNARVAQLAVSRQADMIISHKPVIGRPIEAVNSGSYLGRVLMSLLRNDISCYTVDRRFDYTEHGIAALAAQRLRLTGVSALNGEKGGCCGQPLRPLTIQELCLMIAERLGDGAVRVYVPEGKEEDVFSEIAVIPGAASKEIEMAEDKGAQLLITSDLRSQDGWEAKNRGIAVIDIADTAMEYLFVEYMEQYLAEVTSSDIELIAVPYEPAYRVVGAAAVLRENMGGSEDRYGKGDV